MVNAGMHSRIIIGSAFADSGDLTGRIKSHSDLPKSVAIFRKDRFSRLEKINEQIENAVTTATKLVSSWLMPVVSTTRKTKRSTLFRIGTAARLQQIKKIAVQKMKAFDSAVSTAKKMLSAWNTPTVEQRVEMVYAEGSGKFNFPRFEIRKETFGALRNINGQTVVMENKN